MYKHDYVMLNFKCSDGNGTKLGIEIPVLQTASCSKLGVLSRMVRQNSLGACDAIIESLATAVRVEKDISDIILGDRDKKGDSSVTLKKAYNVLAFEKPSTIGYITVEATAKDMASLAKTLSSVARLRRRNSEYHEKTHSFLQGVSEAISTVVNPILERKDEELRLSRVAERRARMMLVPI